MIGFCINFQRETKESCTENMWKKCLHDLMNTLQVYFRVIKRVLRASFLQRKTIGNRVITYLQNSCAGFNLGVDHSAKPVSLAVFWLLLDEPKGRGSGSARVDVPATGSDELAFCCCCCGRCCQVAFQKQQQGTPGEISSVLTAARLLSEGLRMAVLVPQARSQPCVTDGCLSAGAGREEGRLWRREDRDHHFILLLLDANSFLTHVHSCCSY